MWEMKRARRFTKPGLHPNKVCSFCGVIIRAGEFYWRKVSDRRVVKDLHCQGGTE